MIKQYEGNGLNKIYFISTGRELELYDQELKELDNYTSDLEDKIERYRFELKKAHKLIEDLQEVNHTNTRLELL